ncbi:MAG: PKD domain-containing protein [Planctomycetes bacterium]|nr:PKD domain-containing protein [Planctomycetota bacterium]
MCKWWTALGLAWLCAAAFGEAAWPEKAHDGRHSYESTAPVIDNPAVFWVIDNVPATFDGTCTVIGENNDIYVVRYNGGSYSITEINRKGETVRTYMSATGSAVTSMAVTGDRLYAMTDGDLHAWELGTTSISWSKTDDYMGTVILLDGNDNVCAASASTLYSLDKDGAENWDYPLGASLVRLWPGYDGGAVFISYDHYLLAVNTSGGTKRWEKDIKVDWGTQWDFVGNPFIGPDGTLWAAGVAQGQLQWYALFHPNSGLSNYAVLPPYSNSQLMAIITGNKILFSGSSRLVAGTYDAAVPEIIEDYDANIGFNPTTALTIASGRIYQGRSDGYVYAHSASNAAQVWLLDADTSAAAPTGTMAADQYGTLYVPLSNGTLAAIGESPVAAASGPAWAPVGTPVAFFSTGSGPGIPMDTITYEWDFGDTTSSTDADPTKTYATGGTFTVTLTVTVTETGATAIDTMQFISDDQPPAVECTEAIIYGTVDDASIPPTVTVAGTEVAVDPALHTWESPVLALEGSGATDIDIEATDASGNTGTLMLSILK